MSFFSRMHDNNGYGEHPTIYGHLNDAELHSMYRGEVWKTLDEDHRQQLLQETVNRAAATMGEKGACEVKFSSLGTGTYGCQHGNVIELNHMYFVDDKRQIEFNGHVIQENFADSNYMALETVLHENIHAWQNQCINGTIKCNSEELVREYRANCFTTTIVDNSNGEQVNGSHYMNGLSDGYGRYFYYFQSTERDAHKYSEIQTQTIINENIKNYGSDITASEYELDVKQNGYEATLVEAKKVFGYDNFEHDINTTLMNDYYKTDDTVNTNTELLVHNEMAKSYDYQNGITNNYSDSEHESEDNTCNANAIDYNDKNESWDRDIKCTNNKETDSQKVSNYQESWDRDIKCLYAENKITESSIAYNNDNSQSI